MDDAKIPKFGSFKPRLANRPASRADEASGGSVSTKGSSRDDVRRSRDRADPTRQRSRNPRREHEISTSEVDLPGNSDRFLVDRRGDPKNTEYGSLHRYDIPPYHRAGHGVVMGRSPPVRIDRESSTEKVSYLVRDEVRRSKTSRPLMSKHGKQTGAGYQFVTTTAQIHDDLDVDFIAFSRSIKRRRLLAEPQKTDTTDSYPDYRSIEGKARPQETHDDDVIKTTSDSESEESQMHLERVARQKNSRLLLQARAHPSRIDGWLELAAHQSQIVSVGADPSTMPTSQRRSLAESRLSLFNEALKHMSTGHDERGILLANIIDEGSFVWDRQKQEKKWKEILLDNPHDLRLHQKYLDHVQSDSHAFRFEHCRSTYSQCLKMIRRSDHIFAHEARNDNINLLMRLISFVRDSGYAELATAIWQAILEFRFFRPVNMAAATQAEFLDSFEQFWQSDVPRIGEDGANGWDSFKDDPHERKRTLTRLDDVPQKPLPSLATFAEDEEKLSSVCFSPASTEDENIEDPFRFVMSKDLEEILEHLDINLPENMVLNAFLTSHGLPCLVTDATEDKTFETIKDPFLTGHDASHLVRKISVTAQAPIGPLVQSRRETTILLFNDGLRAFRDRLVSGSQDSLDLILFLDRSLQSLASALPHNEALAEYILAWKLQMFPDTAAKSAKRLLKSRPSCLRLYNGFALIEAAVGKLEKAKDVWSTALQMSSSLDSEAQNNTVVLWHSAMLTYAQQNDEEAALELLLRMGDPHVASPRLPETWQRSASQQLRTKQVLKSEFDRTLFAGNVTHATLYADCLAWLTYLTENNGISAVLTKYKQLETAVVSEAGIEGAEWLAQGKVTLLKHHLKIKRPFKPAIWRDELHRDILRYPQNTMLLELHSQMASHDRLRGLVREQMSQVSIQNSVIEWRFVVSQEFQRMHVDGSGSNINTIRALFKKALLSTESAVQNSPELWIMWLDVEYGHALSSSKEPLTQALQQAKSVFLLGLNHLPWFKQWAVQGMKLLGQKCLSESELRKVYETMLERGLRVRIDLDE